MSSTRLALYLTLLVASAIQAPAASKEKADREKEALLSAPQHTARRTTIDLAQFGLLARAYTPGTNRIVLSVNYIRNLSGILEELPSDLSDYIVHAIAKISPQFGAYREYEDPLQPGVYVQPRAPSPERQKAFRVFGMLEAAADVEKQESRRSVDGMGGRGHGEFSLGAKRNRSRKVKALTITLTLGDADGVSIPGGTASYRILVEKHERENSFSFYVAGNGFGLDSAGMITRSLDDAIQDATAASIIHLLGNALLIPYYRCSPLFAVDTDLDNRLRDALARLTRSELENNIKRFMLVDGYSLSPTNGVSDHDRAVMEVEMRHRSLIPVNDQQSLIDFAFSLWKNLDYQNGAKRVADSLTELERVTRQRQEEEAAQRAAAEAAEKAAKRELALREQEEAKRKAAQIAMQLEHAAKRAREEQARKAAADLAKRRSTEHSDVEIASRVTQLPGRNVKQPVGVTIISTVKTSVTAVSGSFEERDQLASRGVATPAKRARPSGRLVTNIEGSSGQPRKPMSANSRPKPGTGKTTKGTRPSAPTVTPLR